MNWYKTSQSLPNIVYHGTIASIAQKIEQDGTIFPRGSGPGNWSGGFFGGNPSDPDSVYCFFSKDSAIEYAKEISSITKAQGVAVIHAVPDYNLAMPDEDQVADYLSDTNPSSSEPGVKEVWDAYRRMVQEDRNPEWGNVSMDEAFDGFHATNEMMEGSDNVDASYSEMVKDVARKMKSIMSHEDLLQFVGRGGSIAFNGPLKVVKVEYV